MKKVTRIGLAVAALLLAGGFAYLAAVDIPVTQSEIVKTIPNERFFKNH